MKHDTSPRHAITKALACLAFLVLLGTPCTLGSRTTTFNLGNETRDATCLYWQQNTLGCSIGPTP